MTQFRQKRRKRKETWEHLPRFAFPPLCYQLTPLIALSLYVTGSRCWATQGHLNSLTCALVPCSLSPSTCCQNRAACLGVQFYLPGMKPSPRQSGIYKAWLWFKRLQKYPRRWQRLKERKGKYTGNFFMYE